MTIHRQQQNKQNNPSSIKRTLRLNLSYDGSGFCGYQAQSQGRHVEGELRRAIKKFCGQEPILYAAGRTDSKVHAEHQVVSLTLLDCGLSLKQITKALWAHLPKDISVWRVDDMPAGFNARHQSIGKQYVYKIYQGIAHNPFLYNQSLHVRPQLDCQAMKAALKNFIGEHDFCSFRASSCSAAHARRFIWHADLEQNGNMISIDIRGNAFCFNMVRIMVGTVLEVGLKKILACEIKDILAAKDRRKAGITAKPHGLALKRVYYPDNLGEAGIDKGIVFPRYPISKESWPFDNDQITLGPTMN